MDIPSLNMPPPQVDQPGNERYVPDSHEFDSYILPSERKKRKEKDEEDEAEEKKQKQEREEQPEDSFERERLDEGALEEDDGKKKKKPVLKEKPSDPPLSPDAPGNFVDIKV